MHTESILNYDNKPDSYFGGCRADFVDALPDNPQAAILEVGCAHGATGQLALKRGKCARYVGIEISAEVADIAREHLTEVVTGNVETLELSFEENSFDALILSEVLEHLADPWAVIKRLAPLIKPGGMVMASSPNISHYSVILNLIRGKWELADKGVMDRTHLRWFTPDLYRDLFEQAGFKVHQVNPVVPFAPRTRLINKLTGNRFRHCFMRQISIHGRKT